MIRTGLFTYAPIDRLQAYLKAGWMVVDDLGEHHGRWSVLCWHCGCGEVSP